MPLNKEVTRFLDELRHPLREEIEALRLVILEASALLEENIKWNGPNYSVGAEDRRDDRNCLIHHSRQPVRMLTGGRERLTYFEITNR